MCDIHIKSIYLMHGKSYVGFSLEAKPKASACFLAFNLKSAMLEFLWAAANAAKPTGYCG